MKKHKDKQHAYEPDALAPGTEVIVGDDTADEFQPQVKIKRFKGEAWLSIKHPHAKQKDGKKEKVKDGKLEVDGGKDKDNDKVTHRFYEVPE